MVSLDELRSALRPDAPRGEGIGDRDEHADTEHTGENSNWESFHVRCFLVYVTVRVAIDVRRTYFFQGARGSDRPESNTIRSLDSTPSGRPVTTYARNAYALRLFH
jgi:hypothetical protein